MIALAAERFTKNLWTDAAREARGRSSSSSRTVTAGALGGRPLCSRCARAGSRWKQQATLFRTAHHSAALELELTRRDIPSSSSAGLKFPRGGARQDFRPAALGREPAQPAGWRARRCSCPASAGLRPGGCLDAMVEGGAGPGGGAEAFTRRRLRAARGRPSPRSTPDACRRCGLARRDRPGDVGSRCRSSACPARRGRADARRPGPARPHCRIYPTRERFLTELTLDPPARRATRPGRRAATTTTRSCRRSTPPRARSGRGQRPQRRRRLHPVGISPAARRDRGGAAPAHVAMTRARDHLHLRAVALPRPAAGGLRRPPCLRGADALHPARRSRSAVSTGRPVCRRRATRRRCRPTLEPSTCRRGARDVAMTEVLHDAACLPVRPASARAGIDCSVPRAPHLTRPTPLEPLPTSARSGMSDRPPASKKTPRRRQPPRRPARRDGQTPRARCARSRARLVG